MSRLTQLRTLAKLGPRNIARVGAYRIGLKTGLHRALRVTAPMATGPFFRKPEGTAKASPNTDWDDALWWFGWYREPLPGGPPDWFANPFGEGRHPRPEDDWWTIPDFGNGDIKGVWELSRFDWVVAWATTAATGDGAAVDRLNNWLADWARRNPPYKGPNWKCGQETSIRVMHLIAAAWIMGQDQSPEPGLVQLLTAHMQRIAPTMSYALGQQNNHGTSEAAALFLGGTFLNGHDPRAEGWARSGRKWLEDRAATLIEPDGSFSQYSVTYHRVMLDTYALAEAWRRHRSLPAFSDHLTRRLLAAVAWLHAMVDPVTGDAPNIGANDGARLLQLTGGDYRDFRPSVQLAAALFAEADAYGAGPWTAPLRWLGVLDGQGAMQHGSQSFDNGGYHVLVAGNATTIMRYPRFRFRPGQADALHVDLWVDGRNILRDAGTFSYNAAQSAWFAGTSAHNTITFDGRDQMPRLGRFLFGDWLTADGVERARQTNAGVGAAAGYTDSRGARHHRRIVLAPGRLTCTDTVSGRFETACLRWRLSPGAWVQDANGVQCDGVSLSIKGDTAQSPQLGVTQESRYYQSATAVPELAVTLTGPATIITEVTF